MAQALPAAPRDLPSLGEALEAHVLTDDWEAASKQETVLLLESTLGHPDDALASFAACFLAEEAGEEAVPALLGALGAESPVLRTALLRTLNRLTTDDDRVLEAARELLLGAANPTVRAAAAAILAEASGEDARTGRKALSALLASGGSARRAALEEVAALGDPHFLPVLRRTLGSSDAPERELALGGLSRMPPEAARDRRGAVGPRRHRPASRGGPRAEHGRQYDARRFGGLGRGARRPGTWCGKRLPERCDRTEKPRSRRCARFGAALAPG